MKGWWCDGCVGVVGCDQCFRFEPEERSLDDLALDLALDFELDLALALLLLEARAARVGVLRDVERDADERGADADVFERDDALARDKGRARIG